MQHLDLTPFYALDPAWFTPDEMDQVRTNFAQRIADFAFTCASKREFFDAFQLACPPESGLLWPRPLSEGSSRRAYLTSFGLVIKVQRGWHDPLDPADLESRGGSAYISHLRGRRYIANFCELKTSCHWPCATPRIYAAALSFDWRRPSILVSEAVKPLSCFYPDSTDGIDRDKLFIRAKDGQLVITDHRFSKELAGPNDLAFATEGIWLGNVGISADHRFVLLDTGNYFFDLERLKSNRDMVAKLSTDTGGERSGKPRG